ncbi:MAG: type II toxin-antitoxin system VapC family toxin, partial [Verrucomicrobiota bacterium]
MKPKVYLETTIVSYLTARPARDVIMTATLEQTKKWWASERNRFDLFISDIVIREASSGDATAVRKRIEILRAIVALETDSEVQSLARVFLQNMALPAKAADDALHIAIAAVNQMDYLLTWNCRHIANAVTRP